MTTDVSMSSIDPLPGRRAARRAGPRASRLAFGYLATGIALAVSYLLMHGHAREVLYEGVAASAAVATVVGIRRYRPTPSLPWWLLAGGMFMWFLGDVYWEWYPYLTGRELPSPSIADVTYLFGYLFLLVSIGLIVRTRRSSLRAAGWIDAAIVTVVFGLLVWEIALEDSVAHGLTVAESVNIAYPLMDTLLIGLLARMLFAPGPRTAAYSFVVVAIVVILGADIAYAHMVATDWWTFYDSLSTVWLAGYALFGAAALHPTMVTIADAPQRREHPLTRRRTLVLASVAALPVVEFLVSTSIGRDESHVATAVGMLVVLGMVFYRLSSLIGSIERQTVELAGLHHERGLVLDEITRAIEEERTRLAADLHDGPIQRVSGLGMRAYIGLRKLRAGDHGAAAKVLEQIEGDLGREVRALRAMMTQLRPPVLSERGLVDALRDHADTIASERGIVTVVEGSIDGRLNEEVETGLYRIAQEALVNACRHSRAGRIDVLVEPWDHHVRLVVRDDGVGFDAAPRSGHDIGQHFGLLAMRERAAMLHGSLTVTSAPGKGTSVVADVPLGVEP